MATVEGSPLEALLPEWQELVHAALRARKSAYAPYSRFPVGAALRTGSGRIFTGCNVENASSGLTVCAERVAIWKAVSEGVYDPVALAVVTESGAMPCGACRQVLTEFAIDLTILVGDTQGRVRVTSLAELMPQPFSRANLTPNQ